MHNREQIEELLYQPAINVTHDDEGPLSGETTFRGVPYRFSRRVDVPDAEAAWGDWYDLTPIDTERGLPMRAMGHFRSTDSVKWTSMGSPLLSTEDDIRSLFRDFIQRLIDETATSAHWEAFCVAHYYKDSLLEDVRCQCVRMFRNRGKLDSLSDSEIAVLREWVTSLGGTSGG